MIREFFITAVMVCLFPASAVFGQQLQKENLKGTNSANSGRDYAVFYSAGIPESAIWPLGLRLSKDGATIRHTADKGNGDNISVNDKIPFRFIIAPTEEANTRYWAATMGFHGGEGGDNTNLNPDGNFDPNFTCGCKNYFTTEFPKGSWRMPTQREMMLMWLFRDGINAIYPDSQLSGQYWTSTENTEVQAWYIDFSTTMPQSSAKTKSKALKFRCVRDY